MRSIRHVSNWTGGLHRIERTCVHALFCPRNRRLRDGRRLGRRAHVRRVRCGKSRRSSIGSRAGSVFTPNVDHVVKASTNPAFKRAYDRVSLSLADGMPLIWMSRLLGCPLPERVAGLRPAGAHARAGGATGMEGISGRRRARRRGSRGAQDDRRNGDRRRRLGRFAHRTGRLGSERTLVRAGEGGERRPGLRRARPSETGAVDRSGARCDPSGGRARRRRVARFSGRQIQARPAMDRRDRARVAVSAVPGAAAAVAALPGRRPAVLRHHRLDLAAPAIEPGDRERGRRPLEWRPSAIRT